jgi:hypothetical protein
MPLIKDSQFNLTILICVMVQAVKEKVMVTSRNASGLGGTDEQIVNLRFGKKWKPWGD